MAIPSTPPPMPVAPDANQPSVNVANTIVKNHPELTQKSKQLAADAISTNDPNAALNIASTNHLAVHAQAVQDHIDNHHSQSVWASMVSGATNLIGNAVKTAENVVPGLKNVMTWAAKPIQEIQRDYKFLHSVYTDHSVWQGLLATLGVIGGGTAGFFAGGPAGIFVGIDAALAGERALGKAIPTFHDSIAKSEDPNYLISPGRDVSNLIAHVPGFSGLKDTDHGWGQTISGTTDAVFDFAFDPTLKVGGLANSLKSGKNIAVATDEAGKTLYLADKVTPAAVRATTPIAAQSESINKFIVGASGKALTPDQVLLAYNNPLQGAFRRAVDTIAQTKNAVEIQRMFPASQFTTFEAERLAKASKPEAVVNEMAKSLYSKQLLEADYAMRNTLVLPTQTLARKFVNNKMLQPIRQAGSTLNEERNLLLPKTRTAVDDAGNPILNPDGSLKKITLQGGLPAALAKLGHLDLTGANEAVLNSLAAKVRTFTGYKALVVNKNTLELSGKSFDWHDPNLAPQIYNMLYYTMPHDMALEHTAKIMLEQDPALQAHMYGNAVKEAVKAAGLRGTDDVVQRVMSQAQRATTNGELANIAYGHDVEGAPRGYVDLQTGGKQGVALFKYQLGGNAFIDFRELRRAMRESTLHSMLYQKADDFMTFYTDKVFAPLTLFTVGFGLRVASSEALHQIIRAGLGDYLKFQVAQSAAKHNLYGKLTENEIQRFADSAAQALTEEDHAALLSGKSVKENAITKLLAQKADIYKSLTTTERVNEIATDVRNLKQKAKFVGAFNSKIAPYVAKDKLDVITRYQQTMGAGKGLPAGIASDHGSSFTTNTSERVDILSQLLGHTKMPTEELASLTGINPHFKQYWALNLSKMRHEPFAKDITKDWEMLSKKPGWDALSNDEKWGKVFTEFEKRVKDYNQYKELRPNMLGLSHGEPASFANEVVSSFRGLVEGASGKIHTNLMDKIRNNEVTYESDLKDIANTDAPFNVLGKAHKPAWDKPYERLLDVGYRMLVNPIIDHVSREPIFAHYLYEHYRDMKPMLDNKLISEDTALRMAGQKATLSMIPLIHNPALRSQFSILTRNIMPFYFAQEQAMKRVGRLAFTNGNALKTFRSFQMINQGLNNPGFVHTDATGKKYIVYPLLGEWGNALARGFNAMGLDQYNGLPTTVTGNTQSLMTVLPELKVPGLSPIANIVATDLGKRFPWMQKATDFASGGFPAKNWLDTVMPNSSIRAVWQGLTMDQRESAVSNAMNNAFASAYFHGIIDDKFPTLPVAKQQEIMDKIANNAKSDLFIQGLFSFFLPLAPSVQNVDLNKNMQSLRSEFQDLVKKETAKGTADPFATAKDKFFAEHGTQAISYTVSFSKTNENGAQVPISDTTVNWLNGNQDIINSHPNGAAYLIPQGTTGGDIASIENSLLAMHVRSKQTPAEFVAAIYNQKGWVDLGQDYKDYQAALKSAKESNNIQALTIISQAWKARTQEYGLSNPIWYSNYKDPTKPLDAQNALKDLQALNGMDKLKTSPQGAGIKSLLADYSDYHAAIASQTKQGGKLTSNGYLLLDAWNAYLDAKIIENEGLTNVINGVFRRVS